MSAHEARVDALVDAYKSGRTFPTVVKVRDFLGCTLDQAKKLDLEARNKLNADRSTPVVVPAPKVPDDGTKDYARRSDGNADHDLAKLSALLREIVTKSKNASHQAHKIANKHPQDHDLMRLNREVSHLGLDAVSVDIEIERIKANR